MKKEEIALAFSVIAAGCSIVAICVANPRDSGLGLDYMGVIVGVLALLVTVLIGWQIYNSIEINHKVNGIEDVATQITNERMEKYGHTVKSFVLTLNTFALFERNIDEYAFADCTALKTLIFGAKSRLDCIGDHAFENCTSITEVIMPQQVTTVGNWAFSNCTALTDIEISCSARSIGKYAFSNCDSLKSVEIPGKVNLIYEYAFSDCDQLKSLKIHNIREWRYSLEKDSNVFMTFFQSSGDYERLAEFLCKDHDEYCLQRG